MKALNTELVGTSKAWWVVLAAGIILILGGFAYWFWPVAGYAVISQIFSWLLILTGIVQLCVASGRHRPKGWGWWIVGGVINMFIGFMMARSIILSEAVFPYFLALIFVYAGIMALANGVFNRHNTYWWVNLVNGILLIIIGFMIVDAGYRAEAQMVSFITAVGFVYWGFVIAITAFELKPYPGEAIEK